MARPPVHPRSARGAVAVTAALATACAGLIATPAAATAPSDATSATSAETLSDESLAGELTLRSKTLAVQVAADFPRILSYTSRASGATLTGSTRPVTTVTIDGTVYDVDVERTGATPGSASYRLTLPDLPGVRIDAALLVKGSAVRFQVTKIVDTTEHRVGTLEIPGHDLLSVSSTDANASVASAVISPDRGVKGDTFTKVTTETPVQEKPSGSAYAFVSANGLAASVITNSVYDEAQGKAARDGNRLQRQASADGEAKRVGLWSGAWTHRAKGATDTEELPYATVVITGDANEDGTTDWQDGAIAYRDAAPRAKGADEVADRVVTHIPFNFASQATHPFLRTLDDVKHISLATDGLGQMALLKGYGAEGHDSAHPDYGGHYNERAGGLPDLRTLLDRGEDWNADFGVHINATEAYADADAFSEDLVDPSAEGWNWLGQSYYMDQRRDINSGDLASRIGQLADETGGDLDLLYVDVYYNFGWQARALADTARENDFQLATEWSDKFEADSLWSHWSADENYGGASNKGLNSQIVRFIRNAEKDTWNPHPLLGNAQIVEWEGWTGQVDWNAFYRNIWETNLTTKFLQHHEIVQWDDEEIRFTDGVTARGTSAADREILVGDAVVAKGDTYLLPWSAEAAPGAQGRVAQGDKLYHYSPQGGTSTWTLPGELADARGLTMYRLTDTGREKVGVLTVRDGKVTVDAEAGQPYVLYPDVPGRALQAPGAKSIGWGDGTPVANPGFDAADLDAYRTNGAVTREELDNGQHVAQLGAGRSSLSQRLGQLGRGTYAASVWLEVEPGRSRPTTVEVSGNGVDDASVRVARSTARNEVAADDKHSRYYQRVQVLFDVDRPARPTLTVRTGDGEAAVRLDDLRVVPAERPQAPAGAEDVVAFDDFEDVPQGWGPFVKGDAGGVTDPRTHLAERNAPYTQAGWNDKVVDDVIDGEWSLKAHEENRGLVYRTTPATVDLVPGHKYRVSFDYQSGHGGYYTWVNGYDTVASGTPSSVETRSTAIGEQRGTERFSQEVVASSCGDTWVGLRKEVGGGDQTDMVIDNFLVEDLGAADEVPACASLDVVPERAALEPDVANTVTTTLQVHEPADVADVSVTLDVPEGWEVEPTGESSAGTIDSGGELVTTWQVTPRGDVTTDAYTLTAGAEYTTTTDPVGPRTVEATAEVHVVVPPSGGDHWASDLPFVEADNGWGPVERDLSNGEQGQGDGTPISLRGTGYDKGIGTHAPSKVRLFLGERCQSFTATVGVDDIQSRGSVAFEVLGDGTSLVATPVLRGGGETQDLEVDVAGVRYLDLVVTDGGDGVGNDHADWAGAKLTC